MQKTRIPWRGIPAEGGKYGAKHVKSKAVAHGIMVLPAAADWIFICISLPAGFMHLLLHDRQKRGLFYVFAGTIRRRKKPSAVREQRTLLKENIILIIKILDKRNICIYTLKVEYI